MPNLAQTICNYSRCSTAVPNGQRYCENHKKQKPGNQKQSHPWYHIPRYRRARDRYVKENPRCNDCGQLIQKVSKRHLDHEKRWQLGKTKAEKKKLFWDTDNWQTLCPNCHSSKTREEMQQQAFDGQTYIIFGAPFSGKTTYVLNKKDTEDIIVDVDLLFQALTGEDIYKRPKQLLDVVLRAKSFLIDYIGENKGLHNAYIISTEPNSKKRKKLINKLSARSLVIDPGKQKCLERAKNTNRQGDTNWIDLIEKWYSNFDSIVGDRIINE